MGPTRQDSTESGVESRRLGARLSLVLFTVCLSLCTVVGFPQLGSGFARGRSRPVSAAAPDAVLTPQTIAALAEQPLTVLTPEIDAYLSTRAGTVGVAVVVPGRSSVYITNGAALFPLASVAKLPIMMTLLNQAGREG